MSELDEYRDLIDKNFLGNSTEAIDNSSADHAAVLIEKMFQYGKDTVHIFTGCLSDEVYGRAELLEKARGFLARGGKVGIVIQDAISRDDIKQKKFIKELVLTATNNLKVHRLKDEEIRKQIKIHFSVMDSKALRLETDPAHKTAVMAANTPRALWYENVYYKLLNFSDPINLLGAVS